MTTYKTGNPIGSADPKDLYDNSQNFDQFLLAGVDTYEDRLGRLCLTLEGALRRGTPTVFANRQEMNANTTRPVGAWAIVVNDPTASNNGYYIRTAGGWTRTTLQPVAIDSPALTGIPTAPSLGVDLDYTNPLQIANVTSALVLARGHRGVNVSAHVGGLYLMSEPESRQAAVSFTGTLDIDVTVEIPTGGAYSRRFRNATFRNVYVRHVGQATSIMVQSGRVIDTLSNGFSLFLVSDPSPELDSLREQVDGINGKISRTGTLIVGRDSAPTDGSGIAAGTYIYADPVAATGAVSSARVFCKTPGDMRVSVYRRSGNQVNRKSTVVRVLTAGVNELTFGSEDLPVEAGDYLSFSSAAGIVSFTSGAGDSGGHYMFANLDVEAGSLGSIISTARLQFSATISGQVQIQVGEELDNLQEQINQLGPSAGAVSTDGRTLFRYRARIGTLDATTLGQCKILMLGDSWSEHARIPQQLRNVLESRIGGVSAYGWIDAIGGSPMQGLSYGRTGAWTTYSTATGGAVPAVGTGPDGRVVYTDAIDATAQITTTCESFKIYYRDTTGSFRWRVDGGAWTTVSGNGSGDIAVVTIDGLPHASHIFRLETVGNTGTVAILGYLASSSANGAVLHKCGSGGSTGVSMQKHLNNLTPFVADLSPDLAVIILGTNDYRTAGATVEQFRAAVNGVIDRLRSVIPDVGIVLWAPAQSNGSEVTPLTSYVSAMSDIALNKNVEFFSNYASFGDFAQANALGMWLDALHQSPSGARSSVNSLFKTLLY